MDFFLCQQNTKKFIKNLLKIPKDFGQKLLMTYFGTKNPKRQYQSGAPPQLGFLAPCRSVFLPIAPRRSALVTYSHGGSRSLRVAPCCSRSFRVVPRCSRLLPVAPAAPRCSRISGALPRAPACSSVLQRALVCSREFHQILGAPVVQYLCPPPKFNSEEYHRRILIVD